MGVVDSEDDLEDSEDTLEEDSEGNLGRILRVRIISTYPQCHYHGHFLQRPGISRSACTKMIIVGILFFLHCFAFALTVQAMFW